MQKVVDFVSFFHQKFPVFSKRIYIIFKNVNQNSSIFMKYMVYLTYGSKEIRQFSVMEEEQIIIGNMFFSYRI